MQLIPPTIALNWEYQYRIIPSRYPTINVFQDIVPSSQIEEAFYIEGLTNDRLREERGETQLLPKNDHLAGDGASIIMAAFTHIGNPSRFSDGSFGVYYAAKTLNTAIKETVFHRENFLMQTKEQAMELEMRVYVGKILQPLHNLRAKKYASLHDPLDYKPSQAAGSFLKNLGSLGVVYNSVRDMGGECIGAFSPKAISIPKQKKHLVYVWNGEKIMHIYEKKQVELA